MIADHNYWYTNRQDEIDARIYDMYDDLSCDTVIVYTPIVDASGNEIELVEATNSNPKILIDNENIYIEGQILNDMSLDDKNHLYHLSGDLSIKYGATLTIEPGVQIEGDNHSIIIFGNLVVSSAVLNNTSINIGSTTAGKYASLIMTNSSFSNGELLSPTGSSGNAHIELRNNQFFNTVEFTYIWYPIDDTYITGNTFTNCGTLSIGSNHDVFIYNNEFHGHSGPAFEEAIIEDWVQYNNSHCYVQYNKFDYTGTVLKLSGHNSNMIADHNYWYTNRQDEIDARIYDMNDDLSCDTVIVYLPVLDELEAQASIVLPYGLQGIETEAFANTNCVIVHVSESCLYIADYAFAECGNLLYIEIPSSCEVSPLAFYNSPNVMTYIY